MAGEALLARQRLRATGSDGSHVAVEGAVSAQFSPSIPAFAKPVFEQLRRTRHSAQKATAALTGTRAMVAAGSLDSFA